MVEKVEKEHEYEEEEEEEEDGGRGGGGGEEHTYKRIGYKCVFVLTF